MVQQAKSLVYVFVFVTYKALSSPVGNPCDNVVCENGGTCQSEGSSYICKCTDGYSGDSCETQEPNNKRYVQSNNLIAFNGGWSGWSTASGCTVACGGGSISYSRTCNNPAPAHGGTSCSGSSTKSESCNTHSCPVNGGWSGWTTNSGCTVACGGGSMSYSRICNNPAPAHGGTSCSGSSTKSESCNTHMCPVNGGWSDWTATSGCTVDCGGGSMSYSRTCNNPTPAHEGAHCSGSSTMSESCNTHSCPVNGGWSDWTSWATCTLDCGGGTQSKTRTCSKPAPAHDGLVCGGDSSASQSCNTHLCPINGGWSEWAPWNACTVTCGEGTRTKTRSCSNPAPHHGGVDCGNDDSETQSCTKRDCPI
ncbi:coadhesin-like [Mytilus californianus]|uniref:coadhesin-like n=1 Tax=Mytilus californianus TaxID=6549 RepID=UPI0022461F62|nr:coadhesin-like [Mytilus californianus]